MTQRRNLVANPGSGRSLWRAIAKPTLQFESVFYFVEINLSLRDKSKQFLLQVQAQAMVEFALVLPILLLVIFGLLEVGRAIFIFSSATNASRDAVRYATAFGVNENDNLQFQDCSAIRNVARRTGFLLPLEDADIVIEYDTGPDPATGLVPAPFDACDDADGVDDAVVLACGDRVVVTISVDFDPIVPQLVPLDARTIVSSSARSYFGIIELDDDNPPTCN
jgi:hypothetical protein